MARSVRHAAAATLAMLSVATLALRVSAELAVAGPGEKTVATLKAISENDALGLEAWLHGKPAQLRVGDEVGFRFRSGADAYLTTLYVDASGALTVLHSGDEKHRITAGQTLSFPPENSRQRLLAQPPLGSEFVFVIATLEALPGRSARVSASRSNRTAPVLA